MLAQTQWAAVRTCLVVMRLPPQWTLTLPLLLLLLSSLFSSNTFQGVLSAQLATPPVTQNITCQQYFKLIKNLLFMKIFARIGT